MPLDIESLQATCSDDVGMQVVSRVHASMLRMLPCERGDADQGTRNILVKTNFQGQGQRGSGTIRSGMNEVIFSKHAKRQASLREYLFIFCPPSLVSRGTA